MRQLLWLPLLILSILFLSCSSDNSPDVYSLSVTATPEEAGTVTPANGEFESGRTVEISATPNQHWVFDGWEGDHEGTENPTVLTMDSDKDIAALFVKRDYPLTITVNDEEGGTVSERIIQQKSTDYPHGTIVELTAQPNTGWEFVQWEGDLEGDENPAEVTIENETEITAVFEKIDYPLTINTQGGGQVHDKIVEAKAKDYPFGTVVELTAEPDSNWVFSNWTGDIENTENPVTITIDGPKEVTATFLRTFSLVTVVEPKEAGSITPEEGSYVRDTTLTVEAVPENEGWSFERWEGDFSGSQNPFPLTMNGNKTIVAHFERSEFTLSTEIIGEGSVSIDLIAGTETDEGFLFESEVEVTAVPEEDWQFIGWEGDLTGLTNPSTLIIDGNKSITAVFSIFESGTGTESDPYQVATISQLQEIGNHLDSHFVLINDDLDASEASGWNDGAGFEPIGNSSEPFTGSFDGNGFLIENLTINRPTEQYVGLFGYLGEGALIRNAVLQDFTITGADWVGGLAGVNNGQILNSAVIQGDITGEMYVGGLTGLNNSTIENTSSTAKIVGADDVGGLVGINSGTVFRSYATGTVNGDQRVGGLVGNNRGNAEIEESYAEGNTEGNEFVGGLAGKNGDDGNSKIINSYSLGDVSGNIDVGGLVGENRGEGEITSVFAAGNVLAVATNIGGLAGVNTAILVSGYWDIDTSKQDDGVGTGDSSGTEGLETGQITGEDADDNMPELDWVDIWETTVGYPELQWQE